MDPRPSEKRAPAPERFRGSTTYASVDALDGRDQTPRDDLFALLYMLAECHEGTLPWRSLKDAATVAEDECVKAAIKESKYRCAANPTLLCP